jgi:hypothetical protein
MHKSTWFVKKRKALQGKKAPAGRRKRFEKTAGACIMKIQSKLPY